MSKKPPPINKEDIDAFNKAIKGTKPLTYDKVRLSPKIKKTPSIIPRSKESKKILDISEKEDLSLVQGEAFITYKQTSISNKILRKLRKGQYNVEAILDLHGMSVMEAKLAVKKFFERCLDEDIRVVLIIHGKGHHSQMPILKNKLNHWLRNLDVVLAFSSAAKEHGSRGATYVLLKRLTEENEFG